jgi:hypothetical protein
MNHERKVTREQRRGLVALLLFGSAFGYVEAAVVYYLRDLMHFHTSYVISGYHALLNLGFITFTSPIHSLQISPHVSKVEVAREATTIIIPLSVAYIAGKTGKQRFGAFLVSFASWDIMYYVFLKVLDNWPSSLFTKDVYFLIPVTSVGPVLTPLVISVLLLIIGAKLYIAPDPSSRPKWLRSKMV